MPDPLRVAILTPRRISVVGAVTVLLESCCWTLGFLFAQGLVLSVLLAVILIAAFGLHWPPRDELLNWMLETDLDRSFLLVSVPVLGAIFLIMPAIRWREGKDFRQRIGWRSPTHQEAIYSLAMIAPVALAGDVLYGAVNAWWKGDEVIWPFAMALQENSLEHLYQTFQGISYPVLVVALALAPAVMEELVFRGMLGRRLVSGFGIVPGVLMTSALFAAVHGSLPHAVATLPIGILLHILYLQTRTIWIPVLVHFGNNLLAVSMVHFQLGSESRISAMFMATLLAYLCLMLFLLQQRTRSLVTPLSESASAAI